MFSKSISFQKSFGDALLIISKTIKPRLFDTEIVLHAFHQHHLKHQNYSVSISHKPRSLLLLDLWEK
jgi:hypothetical protein